jgi:hypothetical protein
MRVNSLHSRLQSLASSFADDVMAAIRTASLDELVGPVGTSPRRGPGRPRGGGTSAGNPSPAKTKNGRLARRSPEDVAKTLALVVAAIKGTKGKGMRAEEIRTFLKLDVRELPRVLGEGLKTKKLRSKGQKRATTYFAV